MQKPKIKFLLQLFIAIALLVAFIVTPVEFAVINTTAARIEHSERLLETASVTMDYHPEKITDEINRCYVQILHGVLAVFGNSMTVARQFQNLLWMLVLLFGYLSIRRLLTGGWTATIALAAGVVTAWLYPEGVYQLREMVLPVLIVAFVLWLTVLIFTGIWRKHRPKGQEAEKLTAVESPQLMFVSEEDMTEETHEAMKPVVQQIPNVLPEPKKHVKREAVDFAKEIDEQQMHFDIDVAPDDDFDLK